MQEQQYVLRRKVGIILYYSHSACMRALTTYTKVPLAKLLICDATCVECGEPLLVMRDCPVHTKDRPFCADALCPCHHDPAYQWEQVGERLVSGQITEDEAVRIFSGQL